MDVLGISEIPLIKHGSVGSCDESGLGLGCLIEDGKKNEYRFFSMGWQTNNRTHWRGDIVETVYHSGEYSTKPIIIMNHPHSLSYSYPFIIKDIKNDYRIFYGSTLKWDSGNGEMTHYLYQAKSNDLQNWTYYNQPIKSVLGKAQAFSRPSVLFIGNHYHMWFSYRGNKDSYKIGYAESENLDEWQTFFDSKSVITVSEDGWDSEMVCYPFVFNFKGKVYMLYNGNGYGKSGIGLAKMVEE
jgi:hypothetical protein